MSYIDYSGEAHENEPPSRWNSKNLGQYWKARWHERYGVYPKWGAKEVTLLSKLLQRYSVEQLVPMIERCIAHSSSTHTFGLFFTQADGIWADISKEGEDYSWS